MDTCHIFTENRIACRHIMRILQQIKPYAACMYTHCECWAVTRAVYQLADAINLCVCACVCVCVYVCVCVDSARIGVWQEQHVPADYLTCTGVQSLTVALRTSIHTCMYTFMHTCMQRHTPTKMLCVQVRSADNPLTCMHGLPYTVTRTGAQYSMATHKAPLMHTVVHSVCVCVCVCVCAYVHLPVPLHTGMHTVLHCNTLR